jgi:hypothetical protein
MRRVMILLATSAVLAARPSAAQPWVDAVLPERQFDFGTVARGSKIHHAFKLINRTNQDLHIATWETKCGCTEVRVGARDVPPGTQTTIEAVIDTTRFQGFKSSGLTLVLDRPEYARVDLNLTCFIRGDIMFNPGQVDFGIAQRAAQPTVSLTMSYSGGQSNWGVTKMVTQSAYITAKLQEQGRSADGQVTYLLTATLKPTVSSGYFKDEITLFTNDPSSPTIPVSVTANVQSAVSVSPSIINLGHVRVGEVVRKTVLVRSTQAQPFKLTALKASGDELTANPDSDSARPLHMVNVIFTAPKQPGPYNAVFTIVTDLKDEPPAKLTIFATVTP